MLTKEMIEDKIESVVYLVRPAGFDRKMIAIITMENGFDVIGESNCLDPDDFNEEYGKKTSYRNAFDKLWELEGYLAKEEEYRRKVLSECSYYVDVSDNLAPGVPSQFIAQTWPSEDFING